MNRPALPPSEPVNTIKNPEFAAFAGRILRAAGRRVGDGDVEGLAELVSLRCDLDAAIADVVADLRTWSSAARSRIVPPLEIHIRSKPEKASAPRYRASLCTRSTFATELRPAGASCTQRLTSARLGPLTG